MIPVVRTYHRNPVYLRNMYKDENSGGKMETYNQKVNISETEKEFRLDLIAPGYNREEIKVTIDSNELTVASTIEEKNKEEKNMLRQEFLKESFSRTFQLPENIETEKIEATHKNGILSISLPKRAKVEIPVQQIEVK